MKKIRRFFLKLLVEVPAILIAVLLALILSTWKEKSNKDKKIESIIILLTEEVYDNYKVVSFVDTITSNNLKLIEKTILSHHGTQELSYPWVRPSISNIAWKMTQMSDVLPDISPDILTAIASVYQEQERIEYILDNMDYFDINQNPSMNKLDKLKYVRNHTFKLISRYKDLKKRYKEFLDKVKY